MSSFDDAFSYLLFNEGGYSNNPNDSGGPTKYGITLKTLERYRDKTLTSDDVKALTTKEAKDIYYKNYWLKMGCDKLASSAIATCLLDTGVLHGPSKCVLLAQYSCRELGFEIDYDGISGPETIDILNKVNQNEFIDVFHDYIMDRIDNLVHSNSNLKVFYNGWMNRTNKLLTLKIKNEIKEPIKAEDKKEFKMDKQAAWEVVKPHIKGMLVDVLEKIGKAALDEAIKNSGSVELQALASVLEAPFMAALKEQINHI